MTEIGVRKSVRSLKFKLTFAVITILVTLGCCEMALRLAGFAPLYQYGEWKVKLDDEVLFRIVPKSGPEINNYGYRDRDFGAKQGGKYRIAFIGDSFVMGHNVKIDQTLPSVLQKRLGEQYEVFNMGIYGYGPDQQLMRFKKEGKELQPDLVLLGSFPFNDFGDLYKNQLYKFDDKHNLVANPNNPVVRALRRSSTVMLARSAFRGRFLDEESEDELTGRLFVDIPFHLKQQSTQTLKESVELMQSVLAEFRNETVKQNAKIAVVIIPSFEGIKDPKWFTDRKLWFEDFFFNEKVVSQICTQLKVASLDLSPIFANRSSEPFYDLEEHHLSPTGVEAAVDLIVPFLKESGLLRAEGKASAK